MKIRQLLNPFFLAVVSGILIVCLNIAGDTQVKEVQDVYIPPPKEMIYFDFGFGEALAGILWLRLLQDFDYCGEKDKPKAVNRGKDLDEILTYDLQPSRCDEGWVYQMLDRVTDFSPYFMYAYEHGGLILSIAVDDRMGAKKIFDKGLRYFPRNYNLTYSAAYHYQFEVQEPRRAAELMMRAYHLGGPKWLSTLAARLYSKSGSKELAVAILKDIIQNNENESLVEHAAKRLEEVLNE